MWKPRRLGTLRASVARYRGSFSRWRPGFDTRISHVRFVMDRVVLGQGFSEYLGFPCQFSFHWLLHIHHLSSGAGTIGQLVADVPSGLSLTPPTKIYKLCFVNAVNPRRKLGVRPSEGVRSVNPHWTDFIGMGIEMNIYIVRCVE
jgi:hypothetical protein